MYINNTIKFHYKYYCGTVKFMFVFKVFSSTVTYNEMLNHLQFFIVYGNS